MRSRGTGDLPVDCGRPEERERNARRNGPAAQRYIYAHEHLVRCEEENLLAIAPPSGLIASALRDGPLGSSSGRRRERLNVNLEPAAFVRLVDNPVRVRREL